MPYSEAVYKLEPVRAGTVQAATLRIGLLLAVFSSEQLVKMLTHHDASAIGDRVEDQASLIKDCYGGSDHEFNVGVAIGMLSIKTAQARVRTPVWCNEAHWDQTMARIRMIQLDPVILTVTDITEVGLGAIDGYNHGYAEGIREQPSQLGAPQYADFTKLGGIVAHDLLYFAAADSMS